MQHSHTAGCTTVRRVGLEHMWHPLTNTCMSISPALVCMLLFLFLSYVYNKQQTTRESQCVIHKYLENLSFQVEYLIKLLFCLVLRIEP